MQRWRRTQTALRRRTQTNAVGCVVGPPGARRERNDLRGIEQRRREVAVNRWRDLKRLTEEIRVERRGETQMQGRARADPTRIVGG